MVFVLYNFLVQNDNFALFYFLLQTKISGKVS